MSWRKVMLASVLLILGVMLKSAYAQRDDAAFSSWLDAFRSRAISQGMPSSLADEALSGLSLDTKVIELDQKQPENKLTLDEYLEKTVTARRIRTGRAMLHEHAAVLKRIAAKYHVQPEYILALWGIESDYGFHKGNFSVLQSLATLAYEGRRADFFSNELLAALRVLQQEDIAPDQLTGSWAGAMGDCQFIPSTYLQYAADGDNDGHRDIWNNPADIFASTANYLHALGWSDRIGWGEAMLVPDDVRESELDIKHAKPASYWTKRGFMGSDGNGRTHGFGNGTNLLYGIKIGEGDNYYMVTENYQALLQWNRSRYFATAVGTLADQIAGR